MNGADYIIGDILLHHNAITCSRLSLQHGIDVTHLLGQRPYGDGLKLASLYSGFYSCIFSLVFLFIDKPYIQVTTICAYSLFRISDFHILGE